MDRPSPLLSGDTHTGTGARSESLPQKIDRSRHLQQQEQEHQHRDKRSDNAPRLAKPARTRTRPQRDLTGIAPLAKDDVRDHGWAFRLSHNAVSSFFMFTSNTPATPFDVEGMNQSRPHEGQRADDCARPCARAYRLGCRDDVAPPTATSEHLATIA